MINTRFAVVVAVALSIAAIALGLIALMAQVRNDDTHRGRLVDTRLTNTYTGEPMLFPLDDFYAVRGDDGRLHAWYVYAPGYSGHVRGCRLVWNADAGVDATPAARASGLFVDPCGGARFDRDGRLIAGPADRGLDYFATSPSVDGIIVDTKRLLCGAAAVAAAVRSTTPTPAPTVTTCARVSADGNGS